MNGFTLIEIVVTVTIILLLTTLMLSAWPVTRSNQAFVLAGQQLQAILREAQQMALDENRQEACKLSVPEPRTCSDVGVAVRDDQIVLFADTWGANNHYDDSDYVISTRELPLRVRTVSSAAWQSFVFKSVPPRTVLYHGAATITDDAQGELVLQVSQRQRTFRITAYGHVN